MESLEQLKARRLAESKVKEAKQFQKSGDLVGAVDSYLAAMDAVPDYKSAKKEIHSIRKDLENQLKKNKLNPSEWSFYRGVLAYMDRDWSKAYRIWTQRRQIEPKNVVLANAAVRAENNFKRLMLTEREEFFRRSASTLYEQGYYYRSRDSWAKLLDVRSDDPEAIEGLARADREILRVEGKGKDNELNKLFEAALDSYADQRWDDAKKKFIELTQLDPNFNAAQEYITRINKQITEKAYQPMVASATPDIYRKAEKSNPGPMALNFPEGTDNYIEKIKELQTALNRDPSNIRVQQELDKLKKEQDDESERIYKDGLIVYSQGNRSMAITKWKQVLLINPEHKKATAALRKARAEENRLVPNGDL